MNSQLLKEYRKMRAQKPFMLVGSDAKCALDAAKTLLRFRELESLGLVRLRCEPEEESYFDVYGEPEPRRGQTQDEANRELLELLERLGVWWTCSEWFDGRSWERADSCGMHAGYRDPLSPYENPYIIDHMRAAVDALESHQAAEVFP